MICFLITHSVFFLHYIPSRTFNMKNQPHHSHAYVDPKLWPAKIRYAVLANLCFFVWLGNAYSAGLATGFEELAATYRVSFTALSDLVAWSVFSLGVGNLFWMPTALCIGKRPTIVISIIIFLAGTIWSVEAKSLNSLLGSRILASLGMLYNRNAMLLC